MSALTLKGHFDGANIVLDEPCTLPRGLALMVTMLPIDESNDMDEKLWLNAAASSDAFEFLADPAEDIYTAHDGVPFVNAV